MISLNNYITEKLSINKNFVNCSQNSEERLFDLLGYDHIPEHGEGESKYILNWIRHRNINDFEIYISKKTLDYISEYWDDIYSFYPGDYKCISDDEFERKYDDYYETCNCDYDSEEAELLTDSETLLYFDKLSDIKFIVKAIK